MLEEYRETKNIIEQTEEEVEEVIKLTVVRSLAFWITLLLILGLVPSILIARRLDKKDIKKYGLEGPPGIKHFALFFTVLMSVRSKEKAEQASNGIDAQYDHDKDQFDYDRSQTFTKTNPDTSDIQRLRTPLPFTFDKSNEEQEKEFDEIKNSKGKRGVKLDIIEIGGFHEGDRDEEENDEEITGQPQTDNIFKQKAADPEPEIDTGLVAEEETAKIKKLIKKRKLKKKKKRPISQNKFVSENENAAEKIEKGDSQISKTRKTSVSSIAPKKSDQKGRDYNDEYEGGEDTKNNDTQNANTGNIDTANDFKILTGGEEGNEINPKTGKKKRLIKKLIKKKKGPVEEDKYEQDSVVFKVETKPDNKNGTKGIYSNRSRDFDNSVSLSPRFYNLNSSPEKVHPKPSTPPISSLDTKSNNGRSAITKVDEEEVEYQDKAKERHYNGKIYCLTVKYGYRFTNMFTFYNERLPRMLRVFIVWNTVFIMFFITGIFFISKGDTNDVGGMGAEH